MALEPGSFHFLRAAQGNHLEWVAGALASQRAARLVRAADADGYTALHRAAYGGHTEMCLTLLRAGANPTATTTEGWTPLHCAARWNFPATLSLLLQAGADANALTSSRQTPLHIAAEHRARLTTEVLLDWPGVQRHALNDAGDTAYAIAVRTTNFWRLFEADGVNMPTRDKDRVENHEAPRSLRFVDDEFNEQAVAEYNRHVQPM